MAAVELIANIWLYAFYRCTFEESEIAKEIDPEINRKMCLESLGYDISKQKLTKVEGTLALSPFDKNLVYINTEGFRSPEFEKEKAENTYRIFTIGGSTTFSTGVIDNQTYPAYLQRLYDKADLGFNVEVINAGWPGDWSVTETELIKERLLAFDPDLFIVLDGWNDNKYEKESGYGLASSTLWKERWIEVCKMENQFGYDIIIGLQPSIATGKKILTEQEQRAFLAYQQRNVLEKYPEYVEALQELKNYCSVAADLRGIFDYISEPIYFDPVHTGPYGNQIIAEEFYKLSFPIVLEGLKNTISDEGYQAYLNKVDNRLLSNNDNVFLDDSFYMLKEFVAPYKTPKVLPLIFQQ